MPDRVMSCSLVAVLMSSLSAAAAAAGCEAELAADEVFAIPAPKASMRRNNTRMRVTELLRASFINPSLSVNSALADGVGHTIDGQHVCRDAVIHLVRLGVADHVSK